MWWWDWLGGGRRVETGYFAQAWDFTTRKIIRFN